MILRGHHRIIVYGGTGRQGSFWTKRMLDYDTQVIGLVNPRKSGTFHLGLPVLSSASEFNNMLDVALMFVPPLSAKDAVIDACEAGSKLIICLAEHIPTHDVMEMIAVANSFGACIVGPNTAGLVTPGEAFAGIMPAFNQKIFNSGSIGVISRSGSLGTLVCLNLTKHGLGQSSFIGIGGDPIIGLNTLESLKILDHDSRTNAIVICGEIGGSAEEDAADYASTMSKPVVAYIAGKSSPAHKKMGHAGAIMNQGKGDYWSKRTSLEAAGVAVADLPSEIPNLITAALRQD